MDGSIYKSIMGQYLKGFPGYSGDSLYGMDYYIDDLDSGLGDFKFKSYDPNKRRKTQLNNLMQRALQLGYTAKEKVRDIRPLERLTNLLNIGQYASANYIASLLGQTKEGGEGIIGFIKDLGDSIKTGKLKFFENMMGRTKRSGKYGILTPHYDLWKGIKAGLTMEGGVPGDYQDILRRGIGLANTGNIYLDTAMNFQREISGLGLNILLDPLTYISVGGNKIVDLAGDALKASGLAKKGITLADDIGRRAAAKFMAKNYADDLAKRGAKWGNKVIKKGNKQWRKAMSGYYDDVMKILEKDQGGGIRINIPQIVERPGGKWVKEGGKWLKKPAREWHIPFFKESEFAQSPLLVDTRKYARKLGIPQGLRAATAKVGGIEPDYLGVDIYKSWTDQIKYEPSGLFARMFVNPEGDMLKGGDKVVRGFAKLGIVEDAMKEAGEYGFRYFGPDEMSEMATKLGKGVKKEIEHKFRNMSRWGIYGNTKKEQQIKDAYYAVLHGHPEIPKRLFQYPKRSEMKMADIISGDYEIRKARAFVNEMTNKVSKAINDGKGIMEMPTSYFNELRANLINLVRNEQNMRIALDSWGKPLKSGVDYFDKFALAEKTWLGNIIDSTAELLVKEYQFPTDFKNILKEFHLTSYGDNADVKHLSQKAEGFFKSEKEMKETFLHIVKPGKYKKPSFEGADDAIKFIRDVMNPERAKSPIGFEYKKGLFNKRKDYLPFIYTSGKRFNKGRGTLTAKAEEYVDSLQTYLYYLEKSAERNPKEAKIIRDIIERTVPKGSSGKPIVLDGSMYSRIVKDIDEALAKKEVLMDIPELIRIRMNAAYRTMRQYELLENIKGNRKLAIEIPEEIQKNLTRMTRANTSHGKVSYEMMGKPRAVEGGGVSFAMGGAPKNKMLELEIKTPAGYVKGIDLGIPALKDYFVEEKTARYLAKHFLPQKVHPFLKFYDRALKTWKWWVTVPIPSFHSRNIIGNMANNWFANVNDIRVYKEAMKLQTAKADDLAKVMIDINGKKVNGSQVMEWAEKTGVVGGFFEHEIKGGFVPERWGKKIAGKAENVSSFVEENARLAHFLDKLKKGYTIDDAAVSVKKYLFDYSDLTPGDEWMKRIIPFWIWMRNNIPLQIENLIKHPGKFAYMGKLKNFIEGGAEKSFEYKKEEKPDWLAERMHFRLPNKYSIGGKPTIAALQFPQEDITRFMDWKDLMGSLSPAIKIPAELTFNRNLYFGNDIRNRNLDYDRELQTVKTDPYLKYVGKIPIINNILNIRTYPDRYSGRERVEMDARIHHLYRSALPQSRFMNEYFGKLPDPETDPVIRVMNFLGPARVYQYDPKRQEFFELMREIDRFQAIIRKLQGEQVRGGIGRGTGR